MRKNEFIKPLTFAIILMGLAFAGCHQADKNKITIGFSQCTGEDAWRQSQLEEMKRELVFHPDVSFLYKDAHANNETQVEQIRELLSRHISALIVSPNEAEPLTPVVDEAYRKGVPVIVVDRKTNSSLYSAYVGADNYEIGLLAGQYASRLLHGKGRVAEVQGLAGSTPAMERHHGFIKALQSYPAIQVIAELHADWTAPSASQQLEKAKAVALQADLVFAHNDVMAQASSQTYRLWGLGSKVKFIGVDALPGQKMGLSMVADGILTASVLYPTGGKEAINAAIEAVHRKMTDQHILLKTLVIDSTNVGLMKLQTDKILSQQRDIERQQELIGNQLRIYKNQENILYVLLATLIIALILGSAAYLSFRRNKQITQSLRLKNKEILFQQNKLIEYANKAKEATDAKLNFFTNISHEFRTPLTLIFGAVDEISEDNKYRQLLKDQLTMISKNATRLFRMVNQLIDYRKIEVNKMQLQASENDIILFLQDIVSSFRGLAQKRNIDLRFNTSESQLFLWFDPYMLDKVFFNLLSNAFKFTEDYGRISVTAEYSEDKKNAVIEVEDNGPGVPPEDAKQIFEVFYQGKNNKSKGFGLGLPLAKEFIGLHHGSLTLIHKDQPGAVFRVALPLGAIHLLPEEMKSQPVIAGNAKDLYDKEELCNDTAQLFSNLQTGVNEEKDLSVLVIEDNEELLGFLEKRFRKNFEVHIAKDGSEGLKKAFEIIPDIVICDIVMPNKDGLSLTQMMKSNIRTSHIPIILLTARTSEEQQIEGMRAMADYYIAKPFDLHFLEVVVNTLIKNREMLREHYSAECNLEIKQDGPGKLDRHFLSELNACIDNNLSDENLNVEQICKSIGISRVQLYRKVKALLGCSVNEFILNKRLTKAKYLLTQEDLPIAEVAYQVGFSSPSYFSTAFKNKFNMSPKDLKKTKSAG